MYFIYLVKRLFHLVLPSLKAFKEKRIRAGFAQLVRTSARVLHARAEYLVFAISLPEFPTTDTPQIHLTIRYATAPEEITRLSPIVPSSESLVRFRKLLGRGSMAFIAYENDKPVGYSWFSQKVDPYVSHYGSALNLGPKEVYWHDLRTALGYQCRGIGTALASHCMRYLRDRRFKSVKIAVQKNNIPSIKLHTRLGAKQIGKLYRTRILLWEHLKYIETD